MQQAFLPVTLKSISGIFYLEKGTTVLLSKTHAQSANIYTESAYAAFVFDAGECDVSWRSSQ
jgi:hypothetical protein